MSQADQISQVVTLTKSELEFLLGDTRAITGLARTEMEAKLRRALKRTQVKLPPKWREAVHQRIARGEHQVFPPEAAKGAEASKPKARTKAQERAFAKWREADVAVDASALKADDILSLMDL